MDRAKLVSVTLYLVERYFFYPKLRSVLLGLCPPHKKKSDESRGVILDVGGNRGQSTRFFRSIYPTSPIHLFEPIQELSSHYSDFDTDPDIFIHHLAIGKESGSCNFYFAPKFSEISSLSLPMKTSTMTKLKKLILGHRFNYVVRQVKIETLDSFCQANNIDTIKILKIDVEGHEIDVLEGAKNLLSGGRIELVQLESHRDKQRQDFRCQIRSLLAEYGYDLKEVIRHFPGNFDELIFLKAR